MDHERRRPRENLARLAPMRHVLDRVGAHQEEQHGVGELRAKLAERVDGVAQPAAIDLDAPETPMPRSMRLARRAPVATVGMRPWTELNPQERFRK